MFSFETRSESKQKSSFVFVADDNDTIHVNTSTNTKVIEKDIGDFSFLNKSNDNYLAIITRVSDTTVWQLMIITAIGPDLGEYKAEGVLSNGAINIQVREVKQWEDGKTPVLKMICGYEFIMDNKSVAAVQSSLDTFKKKFVWLNQQLDERLKSIIAAAAASMLVHTDIQESTMK